MKKRFTYGLFPVFLIVVICQAGCNRKDVSELPPPEVIVSKVITKKITDEMIVIGEVKSLEKVNLRARVKGFLVNRNFEEGAFVDKGALLFQIEKSEYEAEVESAEADLMTAEANLKNTVIDYKRQNYLIKKDVIAEKSFDLAACAKETAEAQVLAAKAKLQEAKLNLNYTDISAPFTGRIGLATYSVGNVVGPDSNPLGLLVKMDPIGVEFALNEALIVSLLQYIEKTEKEHPKERQKKGEKMGVKYIDVKLLLSNNTDYPFVGSIDFFDNQINPMTGTILVRAVFKNPNVILIPGAYVKVKISSKYKTERMLIPQASMQEDQTGSFVMFINSKNEVEKRNVKLGTIYGTDIVVSEGLKVGDKVIVEGLQKVREGMIVKPVEEKVEDKKMSEKLNQELNAQDTVKTGDVGKNEAKVNEDIKKLKSRLENKKKPEKTGKESTPGKNDNVQKNKKDNKNITKSDISKQQDGAVVKNDSNIPNEQNISKTVNVEEQQIPPAENDTAKQTSQEQNNNN